MGKKGYVLSSKAKPKIDQRQLCFLFDLWITQEPLGFFTVQFWLAGRCRPG